MSEENKGSSTKLPFFVLLDEDLEKSDDLDKLKKTYKELRDSYLKVIQTSIQAIHSCNEMIGKVVDEIQKATSLDDLRSYITSSLHLN